MTSQYLTKVVGIHVRQNDKSNIICGVAYISPTKSATAQQFLTNMSSILCKLKNKKACLCHG